MGFQIKVVLGSSGHIILYTEFTLGIRSTKVKTNKKRKINKSDK